MSYYPTRIWRYLFGPKFVRCHRSPEDPTQGMNYTPNDVEETADKMLTFTKISRLIVTYTMPVWAVYVYRKGYYTAAHLLGCGKFAGWICLFYIGILIVRGLGRAYNPAYLTFIKTYEDSIANPNNITKKKQLKAYDYDFYYWPVDFRWNEVEERKSRKRTSSLWKRISSNHSNPISALLLGLPKECLAYILSHTFGISMVYPGSTSLLGIAMGPALIGGRSKLVEEHLGIRAKLQAEDGNCIDTMFVDRRPRDHPKRVDTEVEPDVASQNGGTLVICCEGNAGFYEVGCMVTPLKCGYSVLGWNHPGFMCSTGAPFPDADKNAIDVVFQYAINKLGFQPPNIIIFAWSIGAFSGINAAVSYPDIKGIFIDATFNDIMPFANKLMPEFAGTLVQYTVRNHLNLNNAENLRSYSGPVSFVRRSNDEVMNLDGPTVIQSNLGNLLLEDFLQHRFPHLFETIDNIPPQLSVLRRWLYAYGREARNSVLSSQAVNFSECSKLIVDSFTNGRAVFPSSVGKDLTSEQKSQIVLFLASKYMQHYNSTHCTPLPDTMFCQPWNLEMLLNDDSSDDSDFEIVPTRHRDSYETLTENYEPTRSKDDSSVA